MEGRGVAMRLRAGKNAAEEARLGSVVEDTLSSTASISRHASTKDGAGGTDRTWVNVRNSVPCSLSAHTSHADGFGSHDAVRSSSEFRASFPRGTDVRERDRVVCEGRTFEVVSVNTGVTADVPTCADLVVTK